VKGHPATTLARNLPTFDTIIVGAGVAGLAAAGQLARARFKVIVLEARNRIGGRVHTLKDSALGVPIELGAEFIHGKPPEIWKLLRTNDLRVFEVEGDRWTLCGQELCQSNFMEDVDHVLGKMSDRHKDESFLRFVARCFPESKRNPRWERAVERAIRYVAGFNAADPSRVGVHWLLKGMEAEEKIQGERAFRFKHGYQDLLQTMERSIPKQVQIVKETVVSGVTRTSGRVEVAARGPEGRRRFTARTVLITVPLGVLKAGESQRGAIRFNPRLPSEKLKAIAKLEMGKAARVTLRFSRRFWEKLTPEGTKRTLGRMSFLFSQDELFPTWWTAMPKTYPLITAWSPFRSAERLSTKSGSSIRSAAVEALSKMLSYPAGKISDRVEEAYFHDWLRDPFSRGAYSYGTVGADGAQEALGRPVANTLFFAGEATDTTGNNGTVHGAIASGKRAAKEIVRVLS
jgi:monoamine oxidase